MTPLSNKVIKVQLAYKKMLHAMGGLPNPKLTPQAMILIACLGHERITPTAMIRRGYWIGSNLSYTVADLARRGIIKKEASKHDMRQVELSLTDVGLKMCETLRNRVKFD